MPQPILNNKDLLDLARILGQQIDFQEVVRLVANKAAQLLKADLAIILMLNPDTRKTVKTIFKDGKTIEQKEYRDIHIHVGGWIISNQKSFLSDDIQNDKRFAKGLFEKTPVNTVAGVPLIIEGIIIGALILLYKDSVDFNGPEKITSLEQVASVTVPFLRNVQKIREYFESVLPDSSLIVKYNNVGLFGKSPRYIEMLHAVEAATKCNARVLLIGNTGTGKELIAKAIHKFSNRVDYPFVAVDCGSIPINLMESEFFGHKKGSFTGANADHIGFFLEANMGTLFLDEINNLPKEMQAKFLRVLQEAEIRPIGDNKVIKTNVRIVAASSVPLKQLVEEKQFREDLFFRLHVYPIYIPDLGERREDIPLLANHFLQIYARKQNKKVKYFHEELTDFFNKRTWAGNIRELENFVERLITLAPDDIATITAGVFPADLQEELNQFRKKTKQSKSTKSIKGQVQDFETQLIKKTLLECNWNQSEAARRLDTSEKNIRYKIEKLNIQKPECE
jgi:transcriptional regulator with GAF, ATPase, and Fis domain